MIAKYSPCALFACACLGFAVPTASAGLAPNGIKSARVETKTTSATYPEDLGKFVLKLQKGKLDGGTYVYKKISSKSGRITYSDVPDFDGLYSGTYKFTFISATQGTFVDNYTGPFSGTNRGTFKILAMDVAARPVAKAKTVRTRPNHRKKFMLKGKGKDISKSDLRYVILSKPKVGKLIVKDRPRMIYKPKAGFTGSVKFRYLVKEGKTKSKPATVTIKVVRGDGNSGLDMAHLFLGL
jgi:hypothetical protein